jgi:hypothetical protein
MTKFSELLLAFPNGELAKTHRRLRIMQSVGEIGDPEVEEALAIMVEQLAAVSRKAHGLPPSSPPKPPRRRPPRK